MSDHTTDDDLLDLPHTAQVSAERDDDGNITRLTIDVSPYAPTGTGSTLADLVDSGTLETWISGAACGHALPHHRQNFSAIMLGTAAVIGQAQAQQRFAALVARDRSGWSWREIAPRAGVHHRTVERQVKADRWGLAERGVWIDARGVHDGGPDDTVSGHLSDQDRTTLALVIAYYREHYEWSETVEITPPPTLDTNHTTQATITPRRHGADPYRLWITRPVRLVGGPHDGATHTARPGDRGWFPLVEEADPRAGRHAYRPADETGTWVYEGVEL